MGIVRRPFARGFVTTGLGLSAKPVVSSEDLRRLEPLRAAWDARARVPVAHAADMDRFITEQIADAVVYDREPASASWLHYARLRQMPGWLDVDVHDTHAVFARAEAGGIDVDDALVMLLEANHWLTEYPWRLGSPTRAAILEDYPGTAWRNNDATGANEAGLTMWLWSIGALVEVGWEPVPCTWSRVQVPVTGAMAHCVSRVLGREIRPRYLNMLYGRLGSCTFAGHLVMHRWSCGLGSRDLCHGNGSPCPLIAGCSAHESGDYPHATAF